VGLVDLILVVLILFLVILGSSYLLRHQFGHGAGKPDKPFTLEQNMQIILADTVMKVIVMLVATPIIMLRTGSNWRDLGVVPRQAGKDVLIGVAAFCMLAPIVYAIQAVLVQFQKYDHPLIKMLEATPNVGLFAMLAFSAAILAPLSEEWAFRVLLQGWLEKLCTYTGPVRDIIVGGLQVPAAAIPAADQAPLYDGIVYLVDNEPPPQSMQLQPSPSPEIQWIDPANPYLPPVAAAPPEPAFPPPLSPLGDGAVPYPWPQSLWKHWLPIAASSLIFALMHFSHGLAWIPLTILALGLGFIYQRTHRILPSITVHFCLNALSMAFFWVQMFEVPKLQGK
jgi:membrane protease YdiL (CAAX protease family)